MVAGKSEAEKQVATLSGRLKTIGAAHGITGCAMSKPAVEVSEVAEEAILPSWPADSERRASVILNFAQRFLNSRAICGVSKQSGNQVEWTMK